MFIRRTSRAPTLKRTGTSMATCCILMLGTGAGSVSPQEQRRIAMHICEVCFMPAEDHDWNRWPALPACCFGCPCEVTKEEVTDDVHG